MCMILIIIVVLFTISFLFSKWYTLRERNREINIQATMEARYMNQREVYEREYGESTLDSDTMYSDNDSDVD